MEELPAQQFVIDRHPTLGDAAERRVAELAVPAAHGAAQVSPVMQHAMIGRGASIVLMLIFLAMITVPGCLAMLYEYRADSALRRALAGRGWSEVSVEMRDSPLNLLLRRTWGTAYSKASGDGMGNVVIGKDGFLFYRFDYDMAIGPPFLTYTPAVLPSIVDYRDQLERRGIHLILLPIPTKTAIIPWKILPDYSRSAGPALNPDQRRLIELLRAQGVDVLDLTDEFWSMSTSGNCPFRSDDSHWTPEAWALTADRLAARVRPYLGDYPKISYTTRETTVEKQGDLAMLMAVNDLDRWPLHTLHLTQVLKDGKQTEAGDEAPVLLLGDSYAHGFSLADGTAGGSSGPPQQLMLRLGTGVQSIAGEGTYFPGSRQVLSHEPRALAHKKVVIWEFTTRNLPAEKVELPGE